MEKNKYDQYSECFITSSNGYIRIEKKSSKKEKIDFFPVLTTALIIAIMVLTYLIFIK